MNGPASCARDSSGGMSWKPGAAGAAAPGEREETRPRDGRWTRGIPASRSPPPGPPAAPPPEPAAEPAPPPEIRTDCAPRSPKDPAARHPQELWPRASAAAPLAASPVPSVSPVSREPPEPLTGPTRMAGRTAGRRPTRREREPEPPRPPPPEPEKRHAPGPRPSPLRPPQPAAPPPGPAPLAPPARQPTQTVTPGASPPGRPAPSASGRAPALPLEAERVGARRRGSQPG